MGGLGLVVRFAVPALLAVSAAPSAVAQETIESGRAIAEARCASCHAVGQGGASPLPPAPPLRDLHRRYPVEHLAEALAEGMAVGHPAMPEVVLEPAEIDAFIAYLLSLEPAD